MVMQRVEAKSVAKRSGAVRAGTRGPLVNAAGGDPLALGLGVFSVGLGLAELFAPRQLARAIGMPDDADNRKVLRGAGLRELACGVGILTQPRPAALLWSRVAGDAMDLLLLAGSTRDERSNRTRLAVAAAAVLGVTVLDLIGSRKLQAAQQGANGAGGSTRALGSSRTGLAAPLQREPKDHGIEVRTAITVNKPKEEVYRYWRKLDNLPNFMSHLESVTELAEGRSRWRAKAPAGLTVEWDAETVEDRTNERLAWRSLAGADVTNSGSVSFVTAPGGRGTEVRVELAYKPPAGRIGALFAKLFGEEPGQQVRSDLRRFKQVMETGEVLHSDASVHAGPHPAQPSAQPLKHEGLLLGSQLDGAKS